MTRDPIWLGFIAVSFIGSVTCGMACALLGGTVRTPITVDCHDGTTCPDGYTCPPLSSPGGQCEADIGTVEQWGARATDAGR